MTVEQRVDRIANTTQDLIESQRRSYEAMADSFISFQKRNVRFLQSGADLAKLQEENLRAASEFWTNGSRMVELQQRNVRFLQSWMTSGVDYLRNQAEDNQHAAEALAQSARDQQEGLRKLGEDYFGLAEEMASTSRSYAEEGMKNAQQMTERVAEQATQVGEQATQQGLRLAEEATEQVEEATEQVEDAAKQADPNSLPIENYDKLNVSEVSGKLDSLSADELEKVRNYEKHNKNRGTLVGEIDHKIAAAS